MDIYECIDKGPIVGFNQLCEIFSGHFAPTVMVKAISSNGWENWTSVAGLKQLADVNTSSGVDLSSLEILQFSDFSPDMKRNFCRQFTATATDGIWALTTFVRLTDVIQPDGECVRSSEQMMRHFVREFGDKVVVRAGSGENCLEAKYSGYDRWVSAR